MTYEYEKIWKWISILYRHHQCYMAREMETAGIGMGQYHFIMAVCDNPGVSQDKLTELGVNKSTVARALSQLEENGYLHREINPENKRAYRLYATQKGREIHKQILEHCMKSADFSMRGLTQEERDQFAVMARRMAENIRPQLCGEERRD